MKNFYVISSFIFLFPTIVAFYKHEWVYFVLAFLIFIFSTLYHLYFKHKINHWFTSFLREGDWSVALTCYLYMFYFIYKYSFDNLKIILAALLIISVTFFILGYKKIISYHKFHPWFHIFAGTISGMIVLFS
jgi:hypothetical protein